MRFLSILVISCLVLNGFQNLPTAYLDALLHLVEEMHGHHQHSHDAADHHCEGFDLKNDLYGSVTASHSHSHDDHDAATDEGRDDNSTQTSHEHVFISIPSPPGLVSTGILSQVADLMYVYSKVSYARIRVDLLSAYLSELLRPPIG